jgi:hypothetical protein
MWVRKSQSEIDAFEKDRKRWKRRLNPTMPLAVGLMCGMILAAFRAAGLVPTKFSMVESLRRVPHPLHDVIGDAFGAGIWGFALAACVLYIAQLLFGKNFGEQYSRCPICKETDKSLCKCGVPWEPLDWWDWVADPQDAPTDNRQDGGSA